MKRKGKFGGKRTLYDRDCFSLSLSLYWEKGTMKTLCMRFGITFSVFSLLIRFSSPILVKVMSTKSPRNGEDADSNRSYRVPKCYWKKE